MRYGYFIRYDKNTDKWQVLEVETEEVVTIAGVFEDKEEALNYKTGCELAVQEAEAEEYRKYGKER